jgi:hypothetical protein
MSGLFLRLAAQASGLRGATLRSPAALPYQAVQQRVEPLESAADRPDLPMESASATEQPVITPGRETAARLPARQRHGPSSPQVPEQQTPAVAPRAFQAHDEPATASPLPNREPTDTHAPFALAVPPGLITQPMRTTTVSFSAQQADATSPQNPRQTTEGHAPSALSGPARKDSAVTEPFSRDDSGPLPLPAALLSPRPVAPKQAVAAVPPTSASPTPSPQPDEVHIHIGRIEVTAIQESAPSKRASRKGTAPLSLDDYLAKRKGDSR